MTLPQDVWFGGPPAPYCRRVRIWEWNHARDSTPDAITQGGEALVRHFFEVRTAGSDNRCGERCTEGVHVGELPFDSIEQLWQTLSDRI
jgi:hypothetical protein